MAGTPQLRSVLVIALALTVALGMTAAPAAAAGYTGTSTVNDAEMEGQAMAASQAQQSTGSVSVGVGAQLSVAVTSTTDEVRTAADTAGFERQVEQSGATEQADVVADRADKLDGQAAEVRADYEAATEAFVNGELSASAYAQQLASLTSKATTTEVAVEQLVEAAASVQAAERQALGITDEELAALTDQLDPLLGETPRSILSQYTGEIDGEIEVSADGGVEISTTVDGNTSRQLAQPRDDEDNESFELTQAEALENATDALSNLEGQWVLTSTTSTDGDYEFEFVYQGTGEGEATVSVDGETGVVFELEESYELEDDGEDDDGEDGDGEDDDENEGPADGTIDVGVAVDNGTATITASLSDSPLEGANVTVDEEFVGTTNANGTIDYEVPAGAEDIEIKVEYNDSETEIEYNLSNNEDEDEDENENETGKLEYLTVLVVDGAPAPGANVTLQVTGNGEPVANATVEIEEEEVGTTGANGTLDVTLPDEEDINIEATFGGADGELEFEFENEDSDEALGATANIDNGTVAVTVSLGDAPLENASVSANGEFLGTTNADGTVTFDIPENASELEIEIEYDELEAELNYDLEDEEEEEEEDEDEDEEEDDEEDVEDDENENEGPEGPLNGEVTVDNGTATLTVSVGQSPVPAEGANITVNGEFLGTADADGTISFDVPENATELEIEIEYGELEAEIEYNLEDDEEEDDEEDEEDEEDDQDDDEDEEDDQDDDEDEEDDQDDDEDDEGEQGSNQFGLLSA